MIEVMHRTRTLDALGDVGAAQRIRAKAALGFGRHYGFYGDNLGRTVASHGGAFGARNRILDFGRDHRHENGYNARLETAEGEPIFPPVTNQYEVRSNADLRIRVPCLRP
jgi:hypothetical protein